MKRPGEEKTGGKREGLFLTIKKKLEDVSIGRKGTDGIANATRYFRLPDTAVIHQPSHYIYTYRDQP